MAYIDIQANPLLSNYVKSFWSVSRDFTADRPFFEILPDGYAELIFSYGTACYLMNAGEPVLLPNPFIIGLLEAPLTFHACGSLTIIAVRLYPWVLVQISSLLQSGTCSYWLPELQQYLASNDITGALSRLQALIQTSIIPGKGLFFEKAGLLLKEYYKNKGLRKLALANNSSSRTLQRVFLRHSGHSIKSIARKIRFEQIRNRIWENPHIQFTQLAYEFNFTDQSHFNKEFKHFSHKTPGQFALEVIVSKKLLEQHYVAFLQATKN